MLWEVEIRPLGRDAERERVCDEFDLLTRSQRGGDLITASARGYLIEGELTREQVERLRDEVLTDPLVEKATARPVGSAEGLTYTVLLKPGVMDPVAQTVIEAARMLGLPVTAVRTFRRYFGPVEPTPADRDTLFRRVLANDAVEHVVVGPLQAEHLGLGSPYTFRLVTVPLTSLDDDGLMRLSRDGLLALSLDEMRAVQAHFRGLGREPTDVELETIAQTWSEHCSHKTLKGTIIFHDTKSQQARTYTNLLKETIFAATQRIREQLGADDWCVSVFRDNAGVVKFDDRHHVCFKVETHNHPSAIEPYGGANTGLGGVIRDVLGTGRAARPVCNTDVFCFAPPDFPAEGLPPGVLHPRRVMQGVVAGVRDYGNRMGIPTVNGAIVFDDRYLANPLVFCGTVGVLPAGAEDKQVRPGDLIVVIGGRTGRDGIHGATFSSLELTHQSEAVSGGAVQIGNPITEKKLADVLLQARDRDLFTAVTDCGAGGFSSAIGEMAAELGASVHLDQAPLKYEGLSYTEIWISESQERMVLAVPPPKWPELEALCRSEDVEAAVLGQFEATGRLRLYYAGHLVADLDLHFLHGGRPPQILEACWPPENWTARRHCGLPEPLPGRRTVPSSDPASAVEEEALISSQSRNSPFKVPFGGRDPNELLLAILGSLSVCSKEWVIRQYDHEVQGGSVIKPLVGVANDGPSDAAVVMPVLGSWSGVAVGCGINPWYGDLDPYVMAAAAIDEAVRNVVAVGADPARIALLDNFCWGNIRDPGVLGALVRAAEACRDIALAYGTPFISGKDSLNNTYRDPSGRLYGIPHTLLISALGYVPDVRQCVTMDLKAPGHLLYLVGQTDGREIGGSHLMRVLGQHPGPDLYWIRPPEPQTATARKLFAAVHAAIRAGLVRSCHDLSEGGLAVAAAEMAFAGGVGAELDLLPDHPLAPEVWLFGESCSRFLVEVSPQNVVQFGRLFDGLPYLCVGRTIAEPRLRIGTVDGRWLIDLSLTTLKEAWQKPLRW